MKILILTGSPRKNGNSFVLVDNFIKGAEVAGHHVERFDAAFKNVHTCIGCNHCGMNGPCVFKDDFEFVRQHAVDADMVVFASPMHYFGLSAQLKTVLDRFYAINDMITTKDAPHKKAGLIVTYANPTFEVAAPIEREYELVLNYLGWQDVGRLIAPGVWSAGTINQTDYPQKAYEFGKTLTYHR
jgi:NAD(P)H-dependent FMN reductase